MAYLTRGIQEIDLEGQGAEDALPRVQILHGGSVSLGETLTEQSAYNGTLAYPGAAEHHQSDPLEIGHVLWIVWSHRWWSRARSQERCYFRKASHPGEGRSKSSPSCNSIYQVTSLVPPPGALLLRPEGTNLIPRGAVSWPRLRGQERVGDDSNSWSGSINRDRRRSETIAFFRPMTSPVVDFSIHSPPFTLRSGDLASSSGKLRLDRDSN